MKIYKECNLTDFEAWSGAEDTINELSYKELDQLQDMIEELHPDGIDETELNDFLRFEDDTIADWLGYADWEDLVNSHREEEE